MGIGNIVGMIGAVLALLGMVAPGLEAWGMVEISWYDLAADFGGLMGGGMLENIIMILIFIGTGILMYKGQCAAGLLIAVVTMLYFFANFVMASEIIRGDVMGWGTGSTMIIIGEIMIIVGGFAGKPRTEEESSPERGNVYPKTESFFGTDTPPATPNPPISNDFRYDVGNSGQKLPFRVTALHMASGSEKYSASLEIYQPEGHSVTGIIADVTFMNLFGEKFCSENRMFVNFKERKKNYMVSGITDFPGLTENIARAIKSVDVIVKKYILDGTPADVTGQETMADAGKTEGDFRYEEFCAFLDTLESAQEILEYMRQCSEIYGYEFAPDFLESIRSISETERIYGNMKSSAERKIREFFGRNGG